VTDSVEARQRLEALAEELREAVQSRDAFLSIASHELKTPLTPLSLKLQSLARAIASAEPQRLLQRLPEDMEVLQRQVRRLSDLVDTLLDVSRIATGHMTIQPEPVDIAALVREVADRFEPELARAGCRLQLDGEARRMGQWDPLRLDQVITNLLSNAVKYGMGKPIRVRIEGTGDRVRLVFQDEGIGISPEAIPRIFEKFERGVSDRHYGGFGLGLYVTRELVEAMGGKLSADSQVGAGATFTVELPLTSKAAASAPPEPLA
jgi:signal transduction histidine kinase